MHSDPGAIRDKRHWTTRIAMVFTVLAVFGLLTANPLLTAAGLAVPPLLFALLWRPGEPPVLLFAASLQWLQVFAPILNANRAGEMLGEQAVLGELRTAAVLGLIAIVVLAIGMRVGVKQYSAGSVRELHEGARYLTPIRLAAGYAIAFVIGQAALFGSVVVPGFRQQLLAFTMLRWAASFLIGWAAVRDRRYRVLAVVVLTIEVAMGFAGYFSGFKAILFLALVLIGSIGIRIRNLFRPALLLVFLLTLALTSFWQAVKDDYRTYLNQGTRGQLVLVPLGDRFGYLLDRAVELRIDDLQSGFTTGLERVGYLEFFARTINMVPAAIPYQHGRLWREALEHIVTPRVLFPNKPAVNDSDRTNEFTGIWVAGVSEGTSISIGYAGESYIDFGPFGMFVPILLLGWFWGWAYRWLGSRTRYRLLGVAFSVNLILGNALYFESSNIKLIGGAVSSLIVLTLLLRYFSERMWRFVSVAPSKETLVITGPAAPDLQSDVVPFLSR